MVVAVEAATMVVVLLELLIPVAAQVAVDITTVLVPLVVLVL